MWEDYVAEYRLLAKVLSVTRAARELPELRRYRVVLIDESHNLRNREGKRYRAIQEYIQENESKCILLSATPYNKTYLDLSSQLRLFVPEDKDLGIRPGATAARARRNRVHPPPPVPGALARRVREKRVRRRLARTDAPLHGAPHAQLHSRTTTPRPTRPTAGSF